MSRPAAFVVCALASLWPQSGAAQDAPPRDRPARDGAALAEPAGTSAIRGRVIAADTGNPIRRAQVALVPASPWRPPTPGENAAARQAPPPALRRPRQATTNAQGMFEFTGLPAGNYRVLASPPPHLPQYLSLSYGASRPNSPLSRDEGQTIPVADAESFGKAIIALPRGAVITGRVTDENADALARVQIVAIYYPRGSRRGQRMGAGAQTDDLGQFRLYGLAPGEYVVAAEAQQNMHVSPNAPAETEEDKVGFLTTFYPGTTDEDAAQRVRARPGSEITGIEIQIGQGRLYRLSGMVIDSQGRPGAQVHGQLVRRTAGSNLRGHGFSTDEQGRFQMRNVPPGNYRLVARQMDRNHGPERSQSDPGEIGSLPLAITADLDNIVVATSPGATIGGEVVFEDGPPARVPTIRVLARAGYPDDDIGRGVQPVPVGADRRFTMKGLMGESVLAVAAPDLYVKSITVGAEDVTDVPREFKSGDRVVITLTSRASTLEGTVTDGSGRSLSDAAVVLFPEEKASWRASSTRTRGGPVDAAGRFQVPGLMPGRYLVVALPRERLAFVSGGRDLAFYEELSKVAVAVVIGENERRDVELKVVEGSGG